MGDFGKTRTLFLTQCLYDVTTPSSNAFALSEVFRHTLNKKSANLNQIRTF